MASNKTFVLEMWGNPYHTYVDEPETIVETSTTSETSQEIIDEKPTASEVIAAQEAWGWNATAVNPAIDPATSETVHDQQVYQEPRQVDEDEMVTSWGWNASGPQTKITEYTIAEDALVSATDEVRELTEAEVEDTKASWGWNTCPTPSQAKSPASSHSKVFQSEEVEFRPATEAEVEHIKSAWAWNSYMMSASPKAPRIVPVNIACNREVIAANSNFVKSNWAWNAYVQYGMDDEVDSSTSNEVVKQWMQNIIRKDECDGISSEKNENPPPPPTPEASPESMFLLAPTELPPPLAI